MRIAYLLDAYAISAPRLKRKDPAFAAVVAAEEAAGHRRCASEGAENIRHDSGLEPNDPTRSASEGRR